MNETLNMTVKYAPMGIWTGIAVGVFVTLVVVVLVSVCLWCRNLSARVEKWSRRVYEMEKGKKADG